MSSNFWTARRWIPVLVMLAASWSAAGKSAATSVTATPDPSISLTGTWVGDLGHGPYDEDWSQAVVTLQQDGLTLTGDIRDRSGQQRELTGSIDVDHVVLAVGGLPGTSTCSYLQLYVMAFERGPDDRILACSGFLQGRCFGTVDLRFRLVRRLPEVRRRLIRRPA